MVRYPESGLMENRHQQSVTFSMRRFSESFPIPSEIAADLPDQEEGDRTTSKTIPLVNSPRSLAASTTRSML
jgi:hypothetical protein